MFLTFELLSTLEDVKWLIGFLDTWLKVTANNGDSNKMLQIYTVKCTVYIIIIITTCFQDSSR